MVVVTVAVVVVVVAVVSVVVLVAVVVVAVAEPVYVVVVDVDVVVVLVSLVVVLVAVVLVTVDVVTVDVVVAMQLRCRCAANGWCCPGGQVGHVLCVASLGMYSVSFGHGSCVSHVYALAVGVVLPPQLPALYSCSPVHCRLSHAWQIYPLPSLPQVPARYCSWAHAAFSHVIVVVDVIVCAVVDLTVVVDVVDVHTMVRILQMLDSQLP